MLPPWPCLPLEAIPDNNGEEQLHLDFDEIAIGKLMFNSSKIDSRPLASTDFMGVACCESTAK